MIKLFSTNESSFSTNGDLIIKPIQATVKNADNGEYSLSLECDLEYADYISENQIIVAPTPYGEQAFRIANLTKTRQKITVKAPHIFYDSQNYLIADSNIVEKNANYALDHLNNATDNASPFTTISDITTLKSYRCVRTSLAKAIETVIEKWGGHLVRDNYSIALRNSIGADNGVVVRYKKNLESIEASYDWSNVCTKLLPTGKNGIMLDQVYVYASSQYDIPHTKSVAFTQNIEQSDYSSESAYLQALKDDLLLQAEEYLANYHLPKVNYKLKAYPEYEVKLGDTIVVKDERLGVDITTTVISYTYDCIREEYKELEFGNFKQTVGSLIDTIRSEYQKDIEISSNTLTATLTSELESATSEIWGAMSNSYVIYNGNSIMIVDTLPKEDATYCILINSAGIGFSSTGINGTFNSAWTIDGTLNMQNINVINFTADLISGGTLKLGSNLNEYGKLEVYDETNALIAELNKNGLKMYGQDGSYIVINNEVGLTGYDRLGNRIYWVSEDEFHQKKAVVEEEITLSSKVRLIPIEVYNNLNILTNEGIGIVVVPSEE